MEKDPLGNGPVFYVPPLRIVAPPGVPAFLPLSFDPMNFFNGLRPPNFPAPHAPSFPFAAPVSPAPPPPQESDTIHENVPANFRANSPLDDDIIHSTSNESVRSPGDDIVHGPNNGFNQAQTQSQLDNYQQQQAEQHHQHNSNNLNNTHHRQQHPPSCDPHPQLQRRRRRSSSPSELSKHSPPPPHKYASFDELKEKKKSNEPRSKKPISNTKRSFSSSSSAESSSTLPPRRALINTLRAYDALRRNLVLEEDSKDREANKSTRPDLNAGSMVNLRGLAVNRSSKVIGSVPGIEVGDQFFFRMEMCCVGMHGPIQGGIEYLTMKESEYGMPVAISIISSGGYDAKDDGEVLIYTGQGGKNGHESKPTEDQKLERGNLAMEGSLKHEIPVRVTRGIKDSASPSGKTYIYDGLYKVEQCWSEKGTSGFEEYKFKLRRLPGQRELGSAVLKLSNSLKYKPNEREGLCLADIANGKEGVPICVVNSVDNLRSPPPFEYTTSLIYPHGASYYQQHFGDLLGCDCTGVCNVSQECSCIAMNGGVFPYLNGGILVKERALVYECGSNCKCPSSCRNRVTQKGMKYRLEIFKTDDRGWGLRSWDIIPAGSFICEYTGKLIDNTQPVQSRDYLLDTSKLPQHTHLWGDVSDLLNTRTSHVKEFASRPDILIDSSQTGNASRFINHSCSPNVFMQCVMWDHHDSKYPHMMLFAMDNIPPFKELTMDYGTQNPSLDSRLVAKHCLCKSEDCKGQFYT